MPDIKEFDDLLKKAKEDPADVQIFVDLYLPKLQDIEKIPERVFLYFVKILTKIKLIKSIHEIKTNLMPLLKKYTDEVLDALSIFRSYIEKQDIDLEYLRLKKFYKYTIHLVSLYVEFGLEQDMLRTEEIRKIKDRLMPYYLEYVKLEPEDTKIQQLWKEIFQDISDAKPNK